MENKYCYWKTETDDVGIFHMYKGYCPNYYWEEYEPDIDTEEYYKKNGLLKNKEFAVIELNENDI